MTFYDDLVGLSLTNSNENLLCTVDAVLIPPQSEALIPVAVPTSFTSSLSVIEPAINLHTKHLALAKAIVFPKQNTTVCKLLNPTNAPIFLKRHSTIAVINKISIESINVIDDSVLQIDNSEPTSIPLEEQLKAIMDKRIKLDQNKLSDEQFTKLANLLYQNLDLFAVGMKDLVDIIVGYVSFYRHRECEPCTTEGLQTKSGNDERNATTGG